MDHSEALALTGMSIHAVDATRRGQMVMYSEGRFGVVIDLDCWGERTIIQRLDTREGEQAMVTVPLKRLSRAPSSFQGTRPGPDG